MPNLKFEFHCPPIDAVAYRYAAVPWPQECGHDRWCATYLPAADQALLAAVIVACPDELHALIVVEVNGQRQQLVFGGSGYLDELPLLAYDRPDLLEWDCCTWLSCWREDPLTERTRKFLANMSARRGPQRAALGPRGPSMSARA
jgi:hypothetical protein